MKRVFRKLIYLLTVLLACTGYQSPSYASDKPIIMSKTDAGRLIGEASKYARSGAGVAIIIMFGMDLLNTNYKPEQVGSAYKERFDGEDTPSRVFISVVDIDETTTTFLTRNNSIGPYSVGVALDNISLAVKEFAEEQLVDKH